MSVDGHLVDIPMCVYNHDKFIAQAIEGVLMQQTTFKYRLLIGEDASTDRSREIIKHYLDKYPEKIQVFFHEKNLGASQNSRILLAECNAKYIALCDGDDYWTDPFKLQKQVDIFAKDSDCSLVFHNTLDVKNDGSAPKYCHDLKDRFYIQDFIHFLYARTVSMVFRNPEQGWPKEFQYMRVADWPMAIWITQYGSARYIPEVMAAYRIHDGGVYTTWDLNRKTIHVFESFLLLSKAMGTESKPLVTEKLNELSFSYFFGSIRIFYFKGIVIGFWYILRSPFALKIRKIRDLFGKR
jgi:glycosyltransferase involved in cell wall biosynthesis